MSVPSHLATPLAAGLLTADAAEPMFELSVVMPCLNEARTVGVCVEKARVAIAEMGVSGEVVVSDNGSVDGSVALAQASGARVVRAVSRGYGAALQSGITAARGRFVVMGDADDSYDFGGLAPFLERLRSGDELVMGNRFKGGILPGAMPWHHRYIGNPILTGILNLFFRSPIGDAHCGLRGFRKEAYERLGLTSTGMEFASEMVVRACLHRQRISEVPVVLHPDGRDRPPHLRSFRDGWRHLRLLLLFCPFWLYLVPAGALMSFGLALMAWLTTGPRRLASVVLDLHTMLLGALCVLLAYQLFWFFAYAKIFGWSSRLLPASTFSLRIFSWFNLERGVLSGATLLAMGLGLNLYLVSHWYRSGFGPLDVQSTLRYALWGLILMVLGAQTISGSFLLSMIGLARHERSPGNLATDIG